MRVILALGAGLATLVGAGLSLVRSAVGDVLGGGPASASELMTAACSVAALAVGAMLWITVTLECVAVLRSPLTAPEPTTGRPLARRLAMALVGASAVGVFGSGAAQAGALSSAGGPTVSWVRQGPAANHGQQSQSALSDPLHATPQTAPDPGFRAAPPTVRPIPDPRFRPTPVASDSEESGAASPPIRPVEPVTVVVHRGDTLWSIAASRLPAGATDTEIAEAWPRWYSANADVIGPDPHRLLPGQVLRLPIAQATS